MKKYLSFISILAFGAMNAQYYQNLNNTGSTDRIADGVNVTLGGQGHLIAGSTNALGGTNLLLTRTDVNGNIAGPNSFNQVYRLSTTNNLPLNAYPVKILQIPNGRICVVGNYGSAVSATPSGIFTAVLNSGGAIISVVGWQTITPSISSGIAATSACNALPVTSNTVYICGYTDATTPNNGARALTLAINGSTNTLIWGRIYDFNPPIFSTAYKFLPQDVVASPYQPALLNEVFVVGDLYDDQGDNFVFSYRVNSANGNPVGTVNLYDSGKEDNCVAVTIATGTSGGGNGFVMAGQNVAYGSRQPFAMKVDATGAVIRWANNYKYSGGGESVASDIIQRQTTSGRWTYYLSSTPDLGFFGGQDMVVTLLDDFGNGLTEWTYGSTDNEYSAELSSFSNTLADGFTVFGNRNYMFAFDAGDEYFVKAYYNGVTACNVNKDSPLTQRYLVSQKFPTYFATGSFGSTSLALSMPQQAFMFQLCYAVTIASGSNARLANTTDETEAALQSSVFPNPVSLNSPVLQLKMNAPAEQQIEIRITDLLGREVLNQQLVVAEGETLQQVQLPSGLSAGVYNMSISGNSVSENHRFVIE
jgi:Secretion system C-terminal sorting domain